MSSANKSSFKPSNPSASGSYEDELLTWLQCPTDDAFERSYCSDVFQEAWTLAPSEGAAAVKSNPQVVTHEQEGNLSSMGTSTCETGSVPCASLVRKHMVTSCKTSPISKASCNTSADEALAQGAARAAGHSSVVGQGAYNNVKTLMQPTHGHPPLIAPRYSFNACKELKDHPIKLNLPVSLVPASPPKPLQNARSMKVNMLESSPLIKTKHTISESATSSSKRARTEYEAHSHTHQTESSRITDEGTIERGKMTAGADRRYTSCSGASQSSMSLSGRETAHSGKHTQEDLDNLTEDYAEDDSMDAKRRSKHPSKRNRVAEVHNLSERKRRNRINEKLKSLQDLIPNSNKTDKASVLDEAIEYMKTLQMQLQMVSMRNSLNVPTMMMPMNLPQGHMQMSQPHSIGLGVPIGHAAGMGLGLGLGIPETGPPTTTTLLQYPAGMSQLHAMPFYSGNMAGYAAHMGFLQNTQLSTTMQHMQEPYELLAQAQRPTYMHQHQQYEQGRSLLCQPCNPEHEAVSIEQDDESD